MMQEDPRLKLLWVGDGWWRDRLLRRVDDLGLAGQVVTTGLVAPEEIPRCLVAMDVLAHPSYREGLPRAVVQALLCARPVIAYDVDGAREVCIDQETGRLVTPGDVAALAEAARSLREQPDVRRSMAERGRELCRERFAASTMVERLATIYAEGRTSGR